MRGGHARETPAAAGINWQLYRLCLLPVLAVLMLAAFSLGDPVSPMTSTLSPEAFEGQRAFRTLHEMVALAPSRAPGSPGDMRLMRFLQRSLRSFGSTSSGGYHVSLQALPAQTPSGGATPVDLIATRPGITTQPPIVLVAHRDLSGQGGLAQLSGTATLLELSRILSSTQTRHPVAIVFSDGGSAGASEISKLVARRLGGSADAAIVLGDLAGATLRAPLVQPYSTGSGFAPEVLTRTVSAPLGSQLGVSPGAPGLASQLAHLAFPLAVGEEGPLNEAGVPAVSVDLAGERGSGAHEAVSAQRLQKAGMAIASAFYSLDRGAQVPRSQVQGITISGRVVPLWAVSLLVLSLMLGPLLVAVDLCVRADRHGQGLGRWAGPVLSCAAPFLLCALALKAIGAIGILHAPPYPAPAAALSLGAVPTIGLLLGAASLALGWRLWAALGGLAAFRDAGSVAGAGVAAHALASVLALLVWLLNPYAALLIVPGLHLWLPLLSPQHRPARLTARLALALAPLAPAAGVILFYALALGLGPGQTLLSGALLVAGGYVGIGASLLWSLALGLLSAGAIGAIPRRAQMGRPRRRRPARRRSSAVGESAAQGPRRGPAVPA